MITLLRRLFDEPDVRTSHPLTTPVVVDGLRVVEYLKRTGYVGAARWRKEVA